MNNDLISRSHFDDRVRLAAGPDADEEFSADFLDGVKTVLYMLSTEPPVSTDNDCVSRSWLLAEYDRQHEGPAGKARKLIEDAPAVPHEMTAREYVRAKNRMCVVYRRNDRETGCWECPLYDFCGEYSDDEDIAQQNADVAVAIVEKWAREHPERSEGNGNSQLDR